MRSTADRAAFDREYEKARRTAARTDRLEPRAKSARYERRTNRIVVELRSGATFMFPVELAQGLAGASPKDLAEVQVTPSGSGLRWLNLDVDFSLSNLLAGEFGSKQWMMKLTHNGDNKLSRENRAKARSNQRSK